jgi:hypothetical protein
MVQKGFLTALGIGLGVAALLVAGILLKQRGSTARLAGAITNVRTLGVEENASVAFVDFRFTNDSKLLFIVQQTGMTVTDSIGNVREGRILSASDTNQLFDLFPALGTKTADPLIMKIRVGSGQSKTAMLAARFEMSKAELDARKKITVLVHEVDGSISELSR